LYTLFSRHYTTIMNPSLPGGDLIDEGVKDLREGRETIAGLLVAIGSPRLRRLGIELPDSLPEYPEHRLYDLLAKDEPDSAHSRYNALIRRLVIFEHTADHLFNPYPSGPSFRQLVERVLNEVP
jgi:hypothetical protein